LAILQQPQKNSKHKIKSVFDVHFISENDVARGSYNVSRVQAAFAGALRQLTEEICRPIYVCPSPKGMLSSVVRVPAEIERYRSWIQARFPVTPVSSNRLVFGKY